MTSNTKPASPLPSMKSFCTNSHVHQILIICWLRRFLVCQFVYFQIFMTSVYLQGFHAIEVSLMWRKSKSIDTFKRNFKTHLFKKRFTWFIYPFNTCHNIYYIFLSVSYLNIFNFIHIHIIHNFICWNFRSVYSIFMSNLIVFTCFFIF